MAEEPHYLTWSIETVAEWIKNLGFPQYMACFTENKINGRKLIYVNGSHLPQLGITDFEHIKIISSEVRELLGIEKIPWNRSISLRHRDNLGLYLEEKGWTGEKADALTYQEFLTTLEA
ncbi:sterile alpha motif domain-containing protein 15 [Latimeria chalumnae]|nr:PREDICTED: sterile alpha motif domain-containing protein 15 [Latimeria chalumnae]|eukprot:XP_005986596.1 PREDICTED: sterile alpha motif domain-containing protein 15 [Latimeria chalumnae]